jgi:PAS domain S-box-containing protein
MIDTSDRCHQLVHQSPDGIFICDDLRIVFLNPAATRLIGASSADTVLGRGIADLLQTESSVGSVRDHVGAIRTGHAAPPFEARLVRLDGSSTDVEVTGTPLDDHERSVQIIVRDITSRKRAEDALRDSEERLRLAFTGAQEGVWDWNLETNAVVYSARWIEMLGYAPDEIEPHVSAWERLLHPDDRARADALNEHLERGGDTYEGEFRLRHKRGHYLDVLSRGYPVRREPGGPVVRIVGTHFDLTERRRADAERARTEMLTRMMFAQEDERRRIAREMHDQFGEQLTALGHAIARLKDASRSDSHLHVHIEGLDGIAKQLDRDVDHLVWELRPTALDDLGLRAALANYVQDWSRRVDIEATFHAIGLLDERLASEAETTLYRIAQEALTNVAKHARATRVDVILERRVHDVLLVVEDNGVGFDPEAHNIRTGFGLPGMLERAALVNATIDVESSVGRGTTILVRVPARSATEGSR